MPPKYISSIILVNYKNVPATIECLESLIQQNAGYLIVVVENGSGGKDAEILKNYSIAQDSRIQILESATNLGFAAGVNLGIRFSIIAGATHAVILNNDTVANPGFGVSLLKSIMQWPSHILVGDIRVFSDNRPAPNFGRISPNTMLVQFVYESWDEKNPPDFVSGCLMVIPITVFKQIGFLREDFFMYCEDIDFCLRLKSKGIELKYDRTLSIRHHVSGTVDSVGFPKEYYRMRNQTRLVIEIGTPRQKFFYGLKIFGVLIKAVIRPRLMNQFLGAIGDAIKGRLGYTRIA
jgi:GT2 family glycosyltransferase